MNNKLFFIFLFAMLTCYGVAAQKKVTITPTAFKQLIGCWQGTLSYNGTIIRKPYTTTAALIVKQTGTSGQFEFVHVYTDNPDENMADTITISADGSKLNNAIITSKRCISNENIEIITTSPGFDHDNNKAAVIRQTYTIGKQRYTYKKEVQLEGQTDWLERQQFTYDRTACSSKN